MTPSKKFRILVADDHAIVRMGLIALLKKEKDMTVIGEAEDGAEAVVQSEKLRPDVVLLDLMMPKMDGAEATAEILAKCPSAHILILTTFGTSDAISKALRSGATGAVQKNLSNVELLSAIREIAIGKSVISADIQETLASDEPIPDLTNRQLQILQSLTRGFTNNEIAKQYGITYDGVKAHLKAIFAKLGVTGRTEAIAIALRKHLLKI